MFAPIPETPIVPKKHFVVPLLIIFVLLLGGIGAWLFYSGRTGLRAVVSPSPLLSQPQVEAPAAEEAVGPIGATEEFDGGLFQFSYPVNLVAEKDQTGTVVIRPRQGEEFVIFIKQTERPLMDFETTASTTYLGVLQVELSPEAPTGTLSAKGNTMDWLFEGKYATYRITMDPSGSVRGLTGKERQIVNFILSTFKEIHSTLVDRYFWRGTKAVPLTFYYPKALHATSTSQSVELSTDRVLMRGCTGERVANCPLTGYTFRLTSVPNVDAVTDKCGEAVSSIYPNLLEVVMKKDAPSTCSQTGLQYKWVFTGKKGTYAIAEDRVGDVFEIPFSYVEKQLLTTLKEK